MKCMIQATLILSLGLLAGCGDLLGKKVIKKKLESSQFRATCDLDVNAFADIMHKNISSQIKCLEENLNIFIKVVKSGKEGYLGRREFEAYILKNRPDIKPEVTRALKSIFDINFLIRGEDPDYISKKNIEDLIRFALVFNEEASLNFAPIFQSTAPVTFALHQNHRDRVSAANKAIIMALRRIFNPNRNGEIHRLNINELLDSFSTEDNRESVDKFKEALFVKRVILGGNKDELNHTELERLLLNFDQLLLITLDAVRYKYIILKQESMLQLLRRDVNDFYDIITQGSLNSRDGETLFSIEEALNVVKIFVERDKFDVEKFRNLIIEVKKMAMGGNASEVKGRELKTILNHARTLTQTGVVFHRIYDKFKVPMSSPLPVTVNFDEYRRVYPEHQKELADFERIVKTYRFIKGEFISPYFTNGFKRNADGIFEIALFEFALKLVFQTYGSPSPNRDAVGGFSIDKDQMQKLVLKFETELIELDLLLPQRAISTADNISLLGSLFQYQSDKNKMLDVNEATEFGLTLFSGINIASDLMTYLKSKGCAVDRFGRIEPQCLKANFFQGFCKSYRSYYPLFFKALNAPAKCEDIPNNESNQIFLGTSIDAARTCNYYTDGQKEEIWYSEGDIMSIMLALIHAETTILRWDANGNNFLDADEVNRAYEIYSPALDGFLEDKPAIIKRFKKQIFQFLIKYEQIPDDKEFKSIWKFVRFLLSFDKKAPAYRKTITSVLKTIGEENQKISTTKPFDCNLLRDPENIPREASELRTPIVDNRPSHAYILESYLHLID
jgi:hypothetical protein